MPDRIEVDVIERKKTPTREQTLADRLKSLRNRDDAAEGNSVSAKSSPQPAHKSSKPQQNYYAPVKSGQDDSEDLFQTDDDTLEELLQDVDQDDDHANTNQEPNDEQVKALLEQLANDIPKDEGPEEKKKDDSDDSDGEQMTKEADDIVARYRDAAELDQGNDEDDQSDAGGDVLALPTVPTNLENIPTSSASANLDDMTARLAALKAPADGEDDGLALPSVPSSKPSGKPIKRLTTKTGYTDDDMDGWCTVCLEDATLRCLGCDDDVYCTRCWKEMHLGPAAAFDDRDHKAVHFTRNKKEKKVAIGAS